MNIWLVGYMGSGKTALAQHFMDHEQLTVLDTDQCVEGMVNMPIHKLWKKHGQQYFRILERQVSLQIAQNSNVIIATGGGLPVHSYTIDEMKNSGKVIYLNVDVDVLWSRVTANKESRPLAEDKDSFKARFAQRQSIYEQADVMFDGTLPIAELEIELQKLL